MTQYCHSLNDFSNFRLFRAQSETQRDLINTISPPLKSLFEYFKIPTLHDENTKKHFSKKIKLLTQ